MFLTVQDRTQEGQSQWHGHNWPLKSKTFIVIRLFQLFFFVHRVHKWHLRLTRIKHKFFFDYLGNSKDLDRNSRVEKKRKTLYNKQKYSWFCLSRCRMYSILLSVAQLKKDGTWSLKKKKKNLFEVSVADLLSDWSNCGSCHWKKVEELNDEQSQR